jgi:L-asparaginase II
MLKVPETLRHEVTGPPLRVFVASDYACGVRAYNGLVFETCAAFADMAGGRVLGRARRGRRWQPA